MKESEKWNSFFENGYDKIVMPTMFELIYGCPFCSATGYEDYPHNSRPCRVEGHEEKYKTKIFGGSSASAINLGSGWKI